MNTRYDTQRDLQDLHETDDQDREISLGTTTILGIFFALALLCAVFFGFGYSMGRRSATPVAAPGELTGAATQPTGSDSKPSSGSRANQSAISPEKPDAGSAQSAIVPADSPASPSPASPSPAAQNTQTQDTQQMPIPAPAKAVVSAPPLNTSAESPTRPVAIIPVAAAQPVPGSSVVQVAAMSHPEDADVVAVDLRRRGYTVAIRHEPQDKLFHVQIGPFSTKKDADAMRQRLQADGYNNSIVK